jgi:hypothetical protein
LTKRVEDDVNSNKNTGGDDVDADQKNSDSCDIDCMLEPDAWKLLEDSYLAKWGKERYPSNSGTSNDGDKQTDDKENMAKVHTESDVADETRMRMTPTSLEVTMVQMMTKLLIVMMVMMVMMVQMTTRMRNKRQTSLEVMKLLTVQTTIRVRKSRLQANLMNLTHKRRKRVEGSAKRYMYTIRHFWKDWLILPGIMQPMVIPTFIMITPQQKVIIWVTGFMSREKIQQWEIVG